MPSLTSMNEGNINEANMNKSNGNDEQADGIDRALISVTIHNDKFDHLLQIEEDLSRVSKINDIQKINYARCINVLDRLKDDQFDKFTLIQHHELCRVVRKLRHFNKQTVSNQNKFTNEDKLRAKNIRQLGRNLIRKFMFVLGVQTLDKFALELDYYKNLDHIPRPLIYMADAQTLQTLIGNVKNNKESLKRKASFRKICQQMESLKMFDQFTNVRQLVKEEIHEKCANDQQAIDEHIRRIDEYLSTIFNIFVPLHTAWHYTLLMKIKPTSAYFSSNWYQINVSKSSLEESNSMVDDDNAVKFLANELAAIYSDLFKKHSLYIKVYLQELREKNGSKPDIVEFYNKYKISNYLRTNTAACQTDIIENPSHSDLSVIELTTDEQSHAQISDLTQTADSIQLDIHNLPKQSSAVIWKSNIRQNSNNDTTMIEPQNTNKMIQQNVTEAPNITSDIVIKNEIIANNSYQDDVEFIETDPATSMVISDTISSQQLMDDLAIADSFQLGIQNLSKQPSNVMEEPNISQNSNNDIATIGPQNTDEMIQQNATEGENITIDMVIKSEIIANNSYQDDVEFIQIDPPSPTVISDTISSQQLMDDLEIPITNQDQVYATLFENVQIGTSIGINSSPCSDTLQTPRSILDCNKNIQVGKRSNADMENDVHLDISEYISFAPHSSEPAKKLCTDALAHVQRSQPAQNNLISLEDTVQLRCEGTPANEDNIITALHQSKWVNEPAIVNCICIESQEPEFVISPESNPLLNTGNSVFLSSQLNPLVNSENDQQCSTFSQQCIPDNNIPNEPPNNGQTNEELPIQNKSQSNDMEIENNIESETDEFVRLCNCGFPMTNESVNDTFHLTILNERNIKLSLSESQIKEFLNVDDAEWISVRQLFINANGFRYSSEHMITEDFQSYSKTAHAVLWYLFDTRTVEGVEIRTRRSQMIEDGIALITTWERMQLRINERKQAAPNNN